ncbi:hypothetical protein [Clostridium sp. FP1]|uniref:hypothetical protein n=1 Tax=Clostridium sp. FP1 TaxID=2724076 RepID=UPI0013E96478|nr:hypothetical protein [Clostridium sp. FP1]MBZ9633032.1 hypothetical protein [Clostridium sp. FP1]
MKEEDSKISFDNYLKSILSKEEINALKLALKGGNDIDTIVIKGLAGATGKSTLARVLQKKGYHVIEGYRIHEVVLNKPLDKMIPIFENDVE